MIQRYFGDGSALDMSIRWSHEPELLGTAGGTKLLQDYWGDETILITSGDGLHDVDLTALLGHHQRTGALATLTVKPVADPSSYGVVILDRDTRVRGFQEKPRRDEARSDLANCGVYVIEPELLERIPPDTFYDFGEDVWPALVAAGEEVYAYTTMAYWNDVGDLDELRNTILDAVLGHVRVEIPGEEISPGVWAEDGLPHRRDARRSTGPSCSARNVIDRGGRADPRPGGDRRRLPRGRGRRHPQRGAPAGERRPRRGARHRRHLRRRLEARRQHPPLPRRDRVVGLRALADESLGGAEAREPCRGEPIRVGDDEGERAEHLRPFAEDAGAHLDGLARRRAARSGRSPRGCPSRSGVAGRAELAADDDRRGVQVVAEVGEDAADGPPGVARPRAWRRGSPVRDEARACRRA